MDDSRVMMTVEEYLAFDRASEDERYEYIDGIVILRVRGTINSSDQSDFDGNADILYSPHLVIEVLSLDTPTTIRRRRQKFIYYRVCPSIQEYVFVNRDEVAVDVYRRINEKRWDVHLFGPGDDVELKSIDVVVPVAKIYENVRF